MSTTRLVILGYLRQYPQHGYELKQRIEDHMGDWTSIAFGSIYFALNKLEQEGLIQKIATEQEGNRPSRSVYRTTAAGEKEFLQLLRQLWTDVDQTLYNIDVGIFFMDSLPQEEILQFLAQRHEMLQQQIRYVEEHMSLQFERGIPRRAQAIFSHSLMHLKTELEWTATVLHDFKEGNYID